MSGPIPKPPPREKSRPKPIQRRTRLRRGGPIRKVSAKRRAQLPIYARVRLIVIARDGGCVLGKLDLVMCEEYRTTTALEVHHVAGRRGERLTDPRGCVSLHRECHEAVHASQKSWRPRLLEHLARIE